MKRILTILMIVLAGNINAQLNITQLGNLTYTQNLSDVWGYVDTSGNEYALVGIFDGFSVVDISTPSVPTEVFFEPGVSSTWRDIKTWDNHAYITTEGGDGLMIVDLSSLPGNTTLTTVMYTGVDYPFQEAHNIYIDENGIAYIFGADYSNGGAIMLDLTQDPMAPIEVGIYDDIYLHDGMVRGDTLYGSHIYAGIQSVIDISDKSNPVMLASWETPNTFAHNCWISDDGNYVYTTDEREYAYIGAYDISDLNNVVETDRWQSNPGTGTIPHNTHFINNYLVTSYYNDGVSIVDVSNPTNLVEVANFDTEPTLAGNEAGGYEGVWGVSPYLPSGNLIVTDINNGLFILGPTYVRACYLEGNVTDSLCGDNLNDVVVEIVSTNYVESTGVSGDYAFGLPTPGTYTVQFSKPGYQTRTISGVSLTNGNSTNIDVKLYSSNTVLLNGTATSGSENIGSAVVQLSGSLGDYTLTTDNFGVYEKCNLIIGTYDIVVSKWGYKAYCETGVAMSADTTLNFELEKEYYDDFISDLGWSVSSTASTGKWERSDPIGTLDNDGNQASPEDDADITDCDNSAYVTGNGGGNSWDDDIDNGTTTITSPIMDLSSYTNPYMNFYTWFMNSGGNSAPNDYISVSISNGISTIELLHRDTMETMSQWAWHSFKLSDYLVITNNMIVIVEAVDDDPGNIVEAGFDVFQIADSAITASVETRKIAINENLIVFPNPFIKTLTVKTANLKNIDYLVVTDVLGKEVKRVNLNGNKSAQIELDVESGVYFVSAYSGAERVGLIKVIRE
ncbi:MAG: choice-of-anchor B family protein [Flavobacteriales bacterium]|nr:choice-of-anchor B family protein [Flavobacteriales bacterium]